MREIKFRAFDNAKKLMFPVWDIRILESGKKRINEGEYFYVPAGIMQYTGIKDKNGRDIYESDIIKQEIYNLRGEKENKIYEIYYERNYFVFPACNVNIEVVGNIYENPELLGEVE